MYGSYLRYTIILVMSLVGAVAHADESSVADTVKVIQTGWGGEGLYVTTVNSQLLEGCTKNVYFFNKSTTPMFDEVTTIMISAFHAKSKVILRVRGCSNGNMNAIAGAIVQD